MRSNVCPYLCKSSLKPAEHWLLQFTTTPLKTNDLDNGTGSRGDTRPQVGALLCDGTGDSRSLHFTLDVYNYPCIIC